MDFQIFCWFAHLKQTVYCFSTIFWKRIFWKNIYFRLQLIYYLLLKLLFTLALRGLLGGLFAFDLPLPVSMVGFMLKSRLKILTGHSSTVAFLFIGNCILLLFVAHCVYYALIWINDEKQTCNVVLMGHQSFCRPKIVKFRHKHCHCHSYRFAVQPILIVS